MKRRRTGKTSAHTVRRRRNHDAQEPSRSPRTSARQQNATYERALHVLALMRRGESMSAACRAEHIKPDTFLRYVGRAVRHDKPGGRFRVVAKDTLTRNLQVPTADGTVAVAMRGMKAAREFSAYLNAIGHFNRTGDTSRLRRFKGRTFTAEGRRYAFLTDPDKLMELAEADALRLDSVRVRIEPAVTSGRVRRSGRRQHTTVLCPVWRAQWSRTASRWRRNHARWFTLPLCTEHHREITRALREAGVDMRPAKTRIERIARAQQGLAVFQWWLGQELLKS